MGGRHRPISNLPGPETATSCLKDAKGLSPARRGPWLQEQLYAGGHLELQPRAAIEALYAYQFAEISALVIRVKP